MTLHCCHRSLITAVATFGECVVGLVGALDRSRLAL